MGKDWQKKRKNDHFYKKAKKKGYRSRAAYKLRQLDKKYRILKSGDTVIDLGAAPGGWLQVAREKVGENGFVLGVDLEEIEDLGYRNVSTIQCDITDPETVEIIEEKLYNPPDVILSDASPDISGVWDVDHARSIDLARSVFSLAEKLLKPGGNILIKVFQGEFFPEFLKDTGELFEFHKSSKPKASRNESAEIYIIGKGFKPN
ncbi:23S rRNA methyltransferase [candidate division MSBL1 archaeon SCGC-AAA259E22]|uniref:Ribosomal RNA large subunit methyltransferase E n=1 Tax=candidate division MSBL1 archaeon SCGC-AAA259E22 TaxID=1698265 RepID=A0A133UFP9_9EURY|nr:23S rRNA methyltransferase [candidate division MSBL1 archaeon SCGC-AAA259E22]